MRELLKKSISLLLCLTLILGMAANLTVRVSAYEDGTEDYPFLYCGEKSEVESDIICIEKGDITWPVTTENTQKKCASKPQG